MAAALAGLSSAPPQIMILSDMLELGHNTSATHQALVPLLARLAPRDVIALGPEMGRMAKALGAACSTITTHFADNSEDARQLLVGLIRDNDQIFIKGSHGSGAHHVACALIASLNQSTESTPDSFKRNDTQEGKNDAA